MFHIQASTAGDLAIIDPERDASLEFIGGRGRVPGMVHTLTTGDLVVPFEARRTAQADAEGHEFYLITFDSFGSLFVTPTGLKLDPVDFTSPAERRRLQLLAAEALLVFGSMYDGLRKPDGFNRVSIEGNTYTLSSFGYESVPD
ncbi:hypothetical protein [Homoserinimonas hongtaonis]|uniref:hypothetical protein n=1 Tax=Homoserinimonas hongtaonis TaxID=2079791 RepID=UPI000D37287C|nr:hypothetical protein [Salinibacterium hongtaonis]AWB88993.1 hypothetical protein C2138_05055 [Salinibacterium hongtaonis]